VGFAEPCIATIASKAPAGPLWIHEIKHNGYRLMAKRGDAVRLLTRNGLDWTERYPRIVEALERLPVKSATIDGEAVWLAEGGIADFTKLHSRTVDTEVCLIAFDLIELDGEDLRKLPLDRRRFLLRSTLAGNIDIHFNEHFEGDGAVLFQHACQLGLEGIVSKRRDQPYRSGRSPSWIKVKNPDSPAVRRLVARMEPTGH
jgi:bifunctional non-homologous end joining protein LigD